MSVPVAFLNTAIEYPSSDGKPMAENTLQFRWIVTIGGNLEGMYRDVPDVFVAGDLLWYPVEGVPRVCTAPDTLVVFGRPKKHRDSYKQWEEDNIPPQVVFEILSKSNTPMEMWEKEEFYEEHGVEEFYVYDPYKNQLKGWRRDGAILRRIAQMNGWVSPLLKIRFQVGEEMKIYGPTGEPFFSFVELMAQREKDKSRAETAEHRAETAEQLAETAEHRAETAEQLAKKAEERAERLRAQLRAAGIDPVNGS